MRDSPRLARHAVVFAVEKRMPIPVPRALVEFILLGPEDDRRQLQDSPILGDVWLRFAEQPGRSDVPPITRLELLITPYKDQPAGILASTLLDKMPDDAEPNVAYLQGVVAAKLSFREVLRYVVPMSYWWAEKGVAKIVAEYRADTEKFRRDLESTIETARRWAAKQIFATKQDFDARRRYMTLAALILWAELQPQHDEYEKKWDWRTQIDYILDGMQRDLDGVIHEINISVPQPDEKFPAKLVFTISLNRRAMAALTKSVPAVKGDAARTLFSVDCSEIVWAVLDSGVDASHPAFATKKGDCTRVKRAFDFSRIRQIVSLDNLRNRKAREDRVQTLLAQPNLKHPPSAADASKYLEQLADEAKRGRPIDWELVERLIEIEPLHKASKPEFHHGTHVGGIIAASRDGAKTAGYKAVEAKALADAASAAPAPSEPEPTGGVAAAGDNAAQQTGDAHQTDGSVAAQRALMDSTSAEQETEENTRDWADGMCPDIQLYDLRVLGTTAQETEFAVIAALQFIRHINERHSYPTIHGANLSLSIPHDVRNYACGRTPVCNECERLVNSGVVVVAAAGNRGYQNFETKDGLYESYAAFSVTDPGNADGVITVGSTHRFWAHTYGVSFFSSRGPTGDGRLKPDLVAPGERIRGPLPECEWGDLDGTSMAAPHVSGAAAMLMARYSELIGQPRRIKQILCESSTDLGREKSFQGHGMLDVLRAFQAM
jgi:hypothetical protein